MRETEAVLDIVDRGIEVTIYYDGDCPFCSDYVRYLRLRESLGAPPRLVNLRADTQAREHLEADGFDLDRGMVADIGGVRTEGAEALQALALLTTRSGLFNRGTAALFSSPTAARWIYPIMRFGRNTVLETIGLQPFRRDESGWQALFTIFSMLFGLFVVGHFFIYAFNYTGFDIDLTTWPVLFLGAALYLRPGSRHIFTLLVAAMAIDAWMQAPLQSNHTILKNFLLMAFIGAGAWHLVRGSRWSDFFRDAVPVGRVLLLVMYFFGVFHKINAGFLDPEVSCAVTLWRAMPWPIRLLDHPIMHYAAIYGTFIVETAIIVMLLSARWRSLGIVAGIGFHTLLALSGFEMYAPFTTLAIALHVLFLSPEQAKRIVSGENFHRLQVHVRSWPGYALLASALLAISYFAVLRDFSAVGLIWLLLAVPIFVAILVPGRPAQDDGRQLPDPAGRLLWSRITWLNILGALFFLNCAMPYLGLKSAQAMNMFANLRLEGGVNNHLVMTWAPAPFGYLDDLVELRSADGNPVIHQATGSQIGEPYYRLLDRLDRHPEASVSFMRNGILYENQTAETLADDIAATLHPAWVRKWFHFGPVLLDNPPPCR